MEILMMGYCYVKESVLQLPLLSKGKGQCPSNAPVPASLLLTKVAKHPWAPRNVLEFAIKTRFGLDSWKTSCCPWMFSGVLENSWI